MLTEQQIELAHPEAFDFAFGALPTAEGVKFIRHLTGCSHCRAVVDEYSEIGEIIKQLPPHVEPSAGLEDRTVAAMTAAMAEHKAEPGSHLDAADHDAEDRAVTRIYPKPERKLPAGQQTQVLPVLRPGPPGGPEPRLGVTHLPVWRRHRGRLTAAVAAAAAIVDRRDRRPAQPYRWPGHPRPSHRCYPPSCHRGGEGLQDRGRDRPSDSPPGRRELDVRSDRSWPQATSRQRRLCVLVGRPGQYTWPRAPGHRRLVRRRTIRISHTHHDDGSRPPPVPHHGDHRRIARQRRFARTGPSDRPNALTAGPHCGWWPPADSRWSAPTAGRSGELPAEGGEGLGLSDNRTGVSVRKLSPAANERVVGDQ